MISVAIITVSDRASRGEIEDKSGPALRQFCEKRGWKVAKHAIVPDDQKNIQTRAIKFSGKCNVVLLTGGTGIAERDVTPEAIRAISTKELPGFGEVMRAKSFERFPNAILSRNLAAVIGQCLIICLPGSPKGAVECLEFVADAIPHAVELLQGNTRHD
ncbi:MAG TPA: MogA/MoaB family molybdenum cofactor biosynthesis protein [Verrucomicrobiae bacterium]|nr:MogA/MoaB family molybdenum cofactor biosynthesis protein [Verrucomicrobiae bacterium]